MKPYSHHDPVSDKGKAIPHPQGPNPVRMISRFERHIEPHPLCEKPFRIKLSRAARIQATADRKRAARKIMESML